MLASSTVWNFIFNVATPNCMKDFASAPFNHQTFKSKWTIPTRYISRAEGLMKTFAEHLTSKTEPKWTPPDSYCGCSPGTYSTKIHLDRTNGIPEFHPIQTTGVFEFDNSTNNLDKLRMAVEMDDACLALASSEMTSLHSGPACGTCLTQLLTGSWR